MKSISIIVLLSIFGFNSYSQIEPTIKLRSRVAQSSNPPLWVIVLKKKTYIFNGNNENFKVINPNTIYSINVMKDAAATAIYGSRAANGVIVIKINDNESRKERKRLRYYLSKPD